jgi:cyclase
MTSRSAVLVMAAGLVLTLSSPASAQQASEKFRWTELMAGVYVVLPNSMGSNSLVVIGEDAVLLVDTQIAPAAARQLLDELSTLSDRPVRYVVNTHWHIDHANGNRAVIERFPEVRILAHESVASEVAAEGEALRTRALDFWTERLEAEPPVRPVDRAALAELGEPFRVIITDPVVRAQRVDLGGRIAEILVPGGGHTKGDLFVYLPEDDIVASGDLLLPMLYGSTGSPLRHLASLRTLRGLNARILVPGHGDVYRSNDHLDELIEQLGRLIDGTREAVETGVSLEEAIDRVVPGAGSLLADPEGLVRSAYAELEASAGAGSR